MFGMDPEQNSIGKLDKVSQTPQLPRVLGTIVHFFGVPQLQLRNPSK
jgi:hypothetical protein